MKMQNKIAALALAATMALPLMAQQTNEADRRDAQHDAKQQRKADKAQAHADKEAHKALKSDKVKDAARSQDKADAEAAKVK